MEEELSYWGEEDMKKKFILIARYYPKEVSGPKSIIQGLIDNIDKNIVTLKPLLYTDDTSKIRYIFDVFCVCLKEKDAIINVHTVGYLLPFVVLLITKLNHKNRYYLTVHGLYSLQNSCKKNKSMMRCLMERIIIKHYNYIICVSEMLKNDIQKKYKRNKNIIVIPNATNAHSEIIPVRTSNKIKILFLGGLQKHKGIMTNISVFAELIKRKINFEAFVYGSDQIGKEKFERMLKHNHLEEYVHYIGMVKDKQLLYDKLAESDIQLCLSNYDTFNVAIAESLVIGCPVIATNTCGASYLIEDGSGIVVDLKNKKDAIDRICDYINSFILEPEKRINVFQKREKYISKFKWSNIVEQYMML